jgi:WD40 repeat protein
MDFNKLFIQKDRLEFFKIIKEVQNVHTKAINCIRYSSDGNYIVTGSDDDKVIVWKTKNRPKFFGSTEVEVCWAEFLIFS